MTEKPWGTTRCLFIDEHSHLDYIEVLRGGFSSIHLHRGKSNAFMVSQGRLRVLEYTPNLELERERVYGPGSPCGASVTVPAGVVHKFEAVTDCKCYELYVTHDGEPIDMMDIVRFSENGLAKS